MTRSSRWVDVALGLVVFLLTVGALVAGEPSPVAVWLAVMAFAFCGAAFALRS